MLISKLLLSIQSELPSSCLGLKMHILVPDALLWLQLDSPLVLKRLNVVYVTVVSLSTTVILYVSFIYELEDIYRSLVKFSAAVGKSSVVLKFKEKNEEFKRQVSLNKNS